MQNLSETQLLLIRGLKLLNVELEAIVGIMLSLETTEQQNEMIDYLVENRQATTEQILKKTVEITTGETMM